MNNLYDVIIIGAGISGMVAAHTILEKEPSLDIIILEAKDKIGGRTLSLPVTGIQNKTCLFDFGAHWMSSTQNHLKKYLRLLNLHIVPQQSGLAIGVHNTDIYTYTDHPIIGNIFVSYEIKWFFSWLEQKSEIFKFGATNKFVCDLYDAMTMDSYINNRLHSTAAQQVVKHVVKTTTGVDASQISVMYYLLLCNSTLGFTNQYMNTDGGGREYWIQEGAYEICNRIQNIIGEQHIKLEEVVIDINYSRSDQKIKILTASGSTYYSTRMICAIPPQEILKINFVPGLSRHKKLVLSEIHPGHLTTFVITFPKPFWRHQGYSGEIFACEDGPIDLCYDATKYGNPALIGYIKEPNNIKLGLDGNFKESVLEQLENYFGKEAEHFIDYKEFSWWDAPYVGGCPRTSPGIGTVKWYHSMAKPSGRDPRKCGSIERISIEWAGAETATEWNGYMDGAIQSGYRAAINTLYYMRPQCMTFEDYICVDTRRTHKIRLKNFEFDTKYSFILGIAISYLMYKGIKSLFSK